MIAIKEKDRVVVAVFAKMVLSDLSHDDLINEENSLIKIQGDTIYCFSSKRRNTDILMCDDKLFDIEVTEKNIVKEIIPYIMKKIKEEKGIKDEKWSNPDWNNTLTIIKDNRLFHITSKFEFIEDDKYICSDSRSFNEYMIGMLDSTDGQVAETRIRKAAKICNQMCGADVYPLMVVDTTDKKIQIWEN